MVMGFGYSVTKVAGGVRPVVVLIFDRRLMSIETNDT